MARIVPSQIVELIDRMWPWAATQKEGEAHNTPLDRGNSSQLAALVALIEQVPPELLIPEGQLYAELLGSVAAIKDRFGAWQTRDFTLSYVAGFPKVSPVALIRRALSRCPDEPIATSPGGLAFIQDEPFRLVLLSDLTSMNRALSNGEWKAATVLAGSVVEALLLWRLKLEAHPTVRETAEKLLKDRRLEKKLPDDLNHWHLSEMIEVSAALGLLSDSALAESRQAKNFRNLIHPGREARLGQSCNRGTALSAVAAVEHVMVTFPRLLHQS